jgi:hypothetical protein
LVIIETIENALDGVHANVTTSGTPNGALSFKICRLPDYTQSGAAASSLISGSTYAVTVPFPALWYVWAVDSDGAVDPGACWVCNTNDPDLRSCGEKIAAILLEHKAGLDAALLELSDTSTVKQIVFGRSLNVDDFPAIIVTKAHKQESYVGLGYIREVLFSFQISFAFFHQDEATQLPIATSMSDRIISILNLPAYSSLVLDTGTPLTGCLATEGDSDEEEVQEKTWAAAATVVWSAQGLIQDTGALY